MLALEVIALTKLTRLGLGLGLVGAMSLTLGSGVALADDYAGQTYSAASLGHQRRRQEARDCDPVGNALSQGDCVVTRSQSAPWLKGDNFSPVRTTRCCCT